MRFKSPYYSEIRTIKKFAWLPIVIFTDCKEVRWMEMVTIKQKYDGKWINVRFID